MTNQTNYILRIYNSDDGVETIVKPISRQQHDALIEACRQILNNDEPVIYENNTAGGMKAICSMTAQQIRQLEKILKSSDF